MGGDIELVFGLVGPIGTDLNRVTEIVGDFLDRAGMRAEEIRLSKALANSKKEFKCADVAKRYSKLMDRGDEYRRGFQRNDAVAALAVLGVFVLRAKLATKKQRKDAKSVAAVIHQLKTPDEVDTLRKIYGTRLVVISCHSSRATRVEALARKIADGANEIQATRFRSSAEELINRDEQDSQSGWGQNVRKTFPKADLFVDVDNQEGMRPSVERLLEILFGHPHRTPTRDEYGMYLAEAAALRSAALGRQVGAVITSSQGDIISVGCNEVPKAGGGLYWEGETPDRRDHMLGFDTNDRYKEKLVGEILKRLIEAKWIRKGVARRQIDFLIKAAIYRRKKPILADTQVDSIIEFGRCVHAEMAAIVDAARRGVSVDSGCLYTTTFPCHECARHIVAAGIRRVVYRLPYPKSLVRELYPDSIDIDGAGGNTGAVAFEPFVGIAPRRYAQFFTMGDRKDDRGNVAKWAPGIAKPNLGDYFPDHQLVRRDEGLFLDEIFGPADQGESDGA